MTDHEKLLNIERLARGYADSIDAMCKLGFSPSFIDSARKDRRKCHETIKTILQKGIQI